MTQNTAVSSVWYDSDEALHGLGRTASNLVDLEGVRRIWNGVVREGLALISSKSDLVK